MFKVMIVDDETIILSGIKSLVNWEEHGCEIGSILCLRTLICL